MNDNKPIREAGAEHLPDEQLDSLLANFRSTVHSWSAQEYARADMPMPLPKRTRFPLTPLRLVTGLAMVAVLVAVPWVNHLNSANNPPLAHHMYVTNNPQVATTAQVEAQAPAPEQETAVTSRNLSRSFLTAKPVASMNDEELMAAVDEDVSQRSPDAMSPLVELMSSDGSATSTQN
jgi:hypothetical protein